MNRLNDEISKRVAEEWENDPRRNKDPKEFVAFKCDFTRFQSCQMP